MRATDRGEFEQVFRSGYPSVLRTAYLVLHDRGRAEEVTQDAFLRLFERWSRIVAYDHPVAWVRTVAIREAIRRAERERRQTVTADVPGRETRDHLPDIDLRNAIAALPPRQRAAVALYYLEDRPVDEIAVLMQVSSSTVKQHLFQARGRLTATMLHGLEEAVSDGE